ncbi:hypothetical protein I6A60_33925 [Frankia sp. AgB1.9]|uniref:hypothetical protein n=1 Tax=unclassified Frankia TaxID=2632575 RepID=UPI001932E9BA|nr:MULTISPECIES: hypothetical protein [unclassified Frankia]MBL7490370.1 hypothetical protein [Frankia sp. AgW1.1]MBL7552819.1 hypothetical protein [Frankia sp. AgB1.9]MBL7619653.1 hypothetical protein [Frankia sp. AgB1.8]
MAPGSADGEVAPALPSEAAAGAGLGTNALAVPPGSKATNPSAVTQTAAINATAPVSRTRANHRGNLPEPLGRRASA